ncbi:MAG: hypothetical protein ACI82G_000314, partial [Bradymonadia bacterium]
MVRRDAVGIDVGLLLTSTPRTSASRGISSYSWNFAMSVSRVIKTLPLLVALGLVASGCSSEPDCEQGDACADETTDAGPDGSTADVDGGSAQDILDDEVGPEDTTGDLRDGSALLDSDEDGLRDEIEGDGDPDGDGVPNYLDDDSDGDGLLDSEEGRADLDADGLPAFLDLDSDGDGLLDEDERLADPDNDGVGAFLDLDSDGDGIDDEVEGAQDPDGDETPSYLDDDSDGDNILDRFEGDADADLDGIPNFFDTDSDGDDWLDAIEYGQEPGSGLEPIDRDGDRFPDYLDADSDADGLADLIERGCPESTERALVDSDRDGIPDLLEVAFAGEDDEFQACDENEQIDDDVDFFFTLPFNGNPTSDELSFVPLVDRADVLFQMDTTGSMGEEIGRLQETLSLSIIPSLQASLENAGFAVSYFEDFPCNGHGSPLSDRPFRLEQRVTTSVSRAQAAVDRLSTNSGNDIPESGLEALYQAATGLGRNNPTCLTTGPEVLPFNVASGFVEGEADGGIGGAGFRDGAVPIIVQMTDAQSHAKGESNYRFGATRFEAYDALARIGGKIVGIASGAAAREDLVDISRATGSLVPACAWDEGRPAECQLGQCCTGADGSGNEPLDGGFCPLVYDISGLGEGLDTTIVAGIDVLANFATFQVNARTRPDLDELARSGIDTSCFIRRVRPALGSGPDRACSVAPEIVDINLDGSPDVFANV